jgi:glycosyltransferase involved in cell wall biosynthesis
MKVIHVPFCFAPDPIGGTEVYVTTLTHDLQGLGVEIIVAAPSETTRTYVLDNLKIRRFAVNKVTDVSQLYEEGNSLAAAEFAAILDQEEPDLVHLHAFTAAISLRLIQAVKLRGVPVIFTYHTPTVSCQRGTLLLWGKTFCDGKLDFHRCAGCTLHGLGIPRLAASVMGQFPPAVGRWLGGRSLQGGFWTALRMTELMRMRHKVFRQMTSEVDHIVAVCKWVQELLLFNDIPANKVSLSRHGVSWSPEQENSTNVSSLRSRSKGIWLAFVGRINRTKGLHVLIEALRMVPTLNINLDVYGVVQTPADSAYRDEMLALAANDGRIAFREPLRSVEIVSELKRYDFLVVPSQWIETGPMVVLEAFAAGVPVIGWNLGGIGEIVQHGVDGLLIEPGPLTGWVEVLRRITEDADLRARLRAGVRPPRTSLNVAREMLTLYGSILQRSGDI